MTEEKNIVIGSRQSRLALAQTHMVADFITKNNENINVSVLKMTTTGDKILDKSLNKVGGKGLFVKELDKALIDKRSDLSVHSLKDVPMEIARELPIIAFSKREDPLDALVLPKGAKEIDFTKPVGTSSLRRWLQFKKLYPDARCKSIRGNIHTRLDKLDSLGIVADNQGSGET